MVWQGLDLEGQGWGEGGVAGPPVAEKKVIGLHGVGCEQQAADGDGGEVIGLLQDGWSGLFAFGPAIADEETGDVAFNEAQVEVCEQVAEVLVSDALLSREQINKGIEYDEASIDALDGLEEGEEIFWKGEGAMTSRVKIGSLLLDEGEDFDAGEIGP